jgi:hypothetical protein
MEESESGILIETSSLAAIENEFQSTTVCVEDKQIDKLDPSTLKSIVPSLASGPCGNPQAADAKIKANK